MAAFPTIKYDWRDLSHTTDPVVERSQMDRGIPKQRRIQSDARVQLQITAHFDTVAQAQAFETWFYNDVDAGQDFFDFTDPWRGVVVQARIVGGKLGPLTFLNKTLAFSKRTFEVEYWRSTW